MISLLTSRNDIMSLTRIIPSAIGAVCAIVIGPTQSPDAIVLYSTPGPDWRDPGQAYIHIGDMYIAADRVEEETKTAQSSPEESC